MKIINANSFRAFRKVPRFEVITENGKVWCESMADAMDKLDIYRKLKKPATIKKVERIER